MKQILLFGFTFTFLVLFLPTAVLACDLRVYGYNSGAVDTHYALDDSSPATQNWQDCYVAAIELAKKSDYDQGVFSSLLGGQFHQYLYVRWSYGAVLGTIGEVTRYTPEDHFQVCDRRMNPDGDLWIPFHPLCE